MMTASTAIKRYCTWCLNGLPKDVCVSESCPLFPVKSGGKVEKSNLKRIKERCLNCVGTNSRKDVEECKCTNCMLFPFRLGKSPNITEESKQKRRDKMTLEKREILVERLKIAREQKKKKEKIKKILMDVS